MHTIKETPAEIRNDRHFWYQKDREYWSVYFLDSLDEFTELHGFISKKQAKDAARRLDYE